jgi:pimeloyl-ACP methyl ester carboxylesterase
MIGFVRTLGLVALSLVASTGCSRDSVSSGDAVVSSSASGVSFDPRTNCGVFQPGLSKRNNLLLGLSIVDGNGQSIENKSLLDCNRDVVIFVHGWSLNGVPTEFFHADLWRSRGFETFVYRWHDLASNPSFETVFESNSVTAARDLETALRQLRTKLGSGFKGEIRLVGHSFGAKVAADVTSRVAPMNGEVEYDAINGTSHAASYVHVARLTLLDPAVFVDWREDEISLCPMLRIGLDKRNEEVETESAVQSEVGRLNALLSLIPESTKVEVFATNVSSTFSFSLARRFPLQTLTKAAVFGCYIKFEGLDLGQIHDLVVPGYFSSIANPAPTLAGQPSVQLNSASVPTDMMVTKPGWYVMKTGNALDKWSGQVFEQKEIPSSYLKAEVGSYCLAKYGRFEDCPIVIKYVKKF